MKILHIYKDYFPVVGGIENHVQLLAEAQAARGHTVTVLVTSPNARARVERQNNVQVVFASRLFNLSSAPFSLDLFGRLRELPVDMAHLHSPYPVGELADLLFGRARAAVLTYHSDIVRQKVMGALYLPILHRVLEHVSCIIATSPNYIESSPVLRRFKQKCVVVPLGIMPPPPQLIQAGTGRELLFVGRLRYYKGLNFLIEALEFLPDAQLTVVGTGPKEHEWRAFAGARGVAGRVRWLGELTDSELRAQYAACDIFVLPCSERSEAFGTVQLEAMAAGKPVVSCDVNTGVAWVNQDGVTGLVVPPKDPRALADAIARLQADAELRVRMGEAGRARVMSEFTVNAMTERVLKVYTDALAYSPEGKVK